MNTKIISALIALAVLCSGLAMLPGVHAGWSHLFCTTDDLLTGNIAEASDWTSPDDGLARIYVKSRPAEVALGPTPPNPPTSHCIVADIDKGYPSGFALCDIEGFSTPTINGDMVALIVEKDRNAPMNPTYGRISVDGTVPNGYVASPPALAMNWNTDPQLTADCTLHKIPIPFADPGTIYWTALSGVDNIFGYGVLESFSNSGPWTEIGQTTGSSIAYAPVMGYWYSLVIYWEGTGTGFLNTQAVRGRVFGEPGLGWVPPSPIASDLAASPDPHNGNTVNEFVTLSATISYWDDSDILSAEYRVDGDAWIAFPQNGYSPLSVSTVFDFPNAYSEGLHIFEVRGYSEYWGYGIPASSSFTITDTTAPFAAWDSVPGPTAYVDFDLVFTAHYEDLTALDANLAGSYFSYSVNGGPWQNASWNATFDGYGSYLYTVTCTLPGGIFLPGDIITYNGCVKDTAITPSTTILGAGGPITMKETPPPYDIPVILGWNLISFPVNASGSPKTVLDDYGGDTVWNVVKWYDGATKIWKSYRQGSSSNTLMYIDKSMGLWVHITTLGDGLLGVVGETPGTTQINLYSGWNLVGYPSTQPKTVGEALAGTNWNRVEVFDPAPPYIKEVGAEYILWPGNGLWVRVPVDVIWTVDW